nr:immunoglobulin light chain junction region [Macaca mulatta]MOV61776.1 immunoglobulin light chain junction region [Macaca mulatta]MOV61826.1 immunoglobulin light chain junction region [Macaca mulatta]MOV62584.1 immunoglobulin light chain junction region [Macaca mulatta]MOV63025.1 immunoglobulin light chain junction region [Macaca mulatta]
CLQYNSDPYSF